MGFFEQHIAGLRCLVHEGEGAVTRVILHGYGANGLDLAPIAQGQPGRWIFPDGPLETEFQGRAWFQLRVEDYVEAVARRDWSRIPELTYPGLDEAAQKVSELISQIDGPVILSGFSQGAIVSLHTALLYQPRLSRLVLWSPCYVERVRWQAAMSQLKCPVLVSHGEWDQVLPFQLSQRLAEDLRSSGCDVRFESFRDGHTIPANVLGASLRFMQATEDPS